MNVPFLGELPLDPAIRIGGDTGKPVMLEGGDRADAFTMVAERVIEALQQSGSKAPLDHDY